MKDQLFGLFFFLAGAFSLAGAIFEWDFFMKNRRARSIQGLLGRRGARILYAIMGALLMIVGISTAAGL